jgi:hypothetical protein
MTPRASLAFGIAILCASVAHGEVPMATLYTLHCSGCHGANGHGVPRARIPDLANSASYLAVPQGRAYLIQVPGIAQSRLDDATAAAMLNWVILRFSVPPLPRDFTLYTGAEIHRLRPNAASDAETQRAVILASLRQMRK